MKVQASEKNQIRFAMATVMYAAEGSKTFQDWIQKLPIEIESKKLISHWFKEQKLLDKEFGTINHEIAFNQISWPAEKGEVAGSLTLLNLNPFKIKINGTTHTLKEKNPGFESLYKTLQKFANEGEVSRLWQELLLPKAQAKSFFSKIPTWLLILQGISLIYAGKIVYDNYHELKEIEKKYNSDEIANLGTQLSVDRAIKDPAALYRVSNIDCYSIEKSRKINPLAKPGEPGYCTYGLKHLRLTPIGKNFGEDDLEIEYAEKDGKRNIQAIRYYKYQTSPESTNQFENNCLIYSTLNKEKPEGQFYNSCTEKLFNKKNMSMNDFKSIIGNINLENYEKLAATAPGCENLTKKVVGIDDSQKGTDDGKTNVPDSANPLKVENPPADQGAK